MATLKDEYIKSNWNGNLWKCERHNIVGRKNGDDDEKEVYRRNELNGLSGPKIRNKYTPALGGTDRFMTEEHLQKFTTSSKEAYDDAKRGPEEKNKDAAEKAKLRLVYDEKFKNWSLKRFGGNKARARRAGWMPFEEWFAKKKAGKPTYSKSELDGALVDVLQQNSVRQYVKKKVVTPPPPPGAGTKK